MSTTYTSTIEVNVWKEHTCVSCGTKYRYLFKRTKQGTGATPDGASANAHNAVIQALEKEVDMHPCPGCGTYQPDMIASQRSTRHWWTFWLGLPVFPLLIILALTDVIPYPTVSWLLAVSGAMLLLIHLTFDAFNSNANLDANHQLAKDRQESGELWVPGRSKGEGGVEAGSGVNAGHYVGYAMLGAGVLGFIAPALMLLVSGWPSNPDWNPEVVGPGDQTYVYFKDRITSVKGHWSGSPQATILNWNELNIPGPPPVLVATSNQGNWGGTISISSKESKTSSPLLWSYVTFPADDRLVGKKLQLQILMSVRYPMLDAGGSSYSDVTKPYTYNGSVTLAGRNAGATYKSIWWIGTLGGLLLTVIGGLVLPLASSAFAAKAHKTEIFAPEGPGDHDDGEPLEEVDGGGRSAGPPASSRDDDRIRADDDDDELKRRWRKE